MPTVANSYAVYCNSNYLLSYVNAAVNIRSWRFINP